MDHALVCGPQPTKETQCLKLLQTSQSQNEGSKDPSQLTATTPPLLPSYPGPLHGCDPYNREWQGEVGSMFHSNCQTQKR
jgi:hypothetical protein